MDWHGGHWRWELPPSVPLDVAFDTVLAARSALHIRQFAISQSTLEQVFLKFARLQV